MKISKKAAAELGKILAQTLHNCGTVEKRGAVLDARVDIGVAMPWAVYRAFNDGFLAELDILEPLPIAGPRR